MIVVARAGQTSATVSFNMVEQCTISAALTARDGLLVCIHTLKHSAFVCVMLSHEVAVVLPGPGWRAAGLGWDHEEAGSGGHVAHCTWHAMVMSSLQWSFILRTINPGVSI